MDEVCATTCRSTQRTPVAGVRLTFLAFGKFPEPSVSWCAAKFVAEVRDADGGFK